MLNRAQLIGHLGRDPDTRYLPDGTSVATLSLATTEKWTDKQGARQERTEWHRAVAYGKLGEICSQYLRKGSLVYLEGRIETQKWTDKAGIERYATSIRMDQMRMLSGRPEGERAAARPATAANALPTDGAPFDDDIPF